MGKAAVVNGGTSNHEQMNTYIQKYKYIYTNTNSNTNTNTGTSIVANTKCETSNHKPPHIHRYRYRLAEPVSLNSLLDILFTFRSNVRIDTWWIQPCTYPEYMCSIRGCMKQKNEPLFEFSPFFLCFAALHCMRCSFRNRINPKWQTLGQGILWIIARTTITEYCSCPTQCKKLPQPNMILIKFQGRVQLLNNEQVWPSNKVHTV